MDATSDRQQTLTEFMSPAKGKRVWQIILAVLLSLMILGAVYEFNKPQAEPVRMSTALSGSTYCYVDVSLVSNWLLKVTGDENYTLYEAMDPDGNWFILNLDDETLALLPGEQPALLEPGHRDDPQAPVEVELIGRGEAKLAGAHTSEHQQPDAQLRVQAPAVLAQCLQHNRQLVHAQERVVFDRRQRQRDHFQVPGRVIAHVGIATVA